MYNVYEMTTEDDFVPLFNAAKAFYKAANLPFDLDPDSFITAIAHMVESPDCAILTDGEGSFIGGRISNSWINNEHKIAQEAFWWAVPGKGLDLLYAFEQWAKDNGADAVLMINLPQLRGNVVERLYERKGYELFERSYYKELV
jgi:hypothetical protein